VEKTERASPGNIENLFNDKRSEKEELCSLHVMIGLDASGSTEFNSKYFNEFIPHTTYAERFKNPEELIDKVRPMVLEIVKAVL
jgi:hypothetical protein